MRLLKKYVNGISDVKNIQMFHVENKDILSRGFLNMKEQTVFSLQLSSFTIFFDFSGFFDLLLESQQISVFLDFGGRSPKFARSKLSRSRQFH